MENKKTTINIFCAHEQQATPHRAEVDQNGEYVFSCESDGCDRFIKVPADITPEQFKEFIAKHEEHNTGQISVDKQNAKLMTLLGALEEVQVEETQPAEEPIEEVKQPEIVEEQPIA